ncbi:MAG: thiol-disulfide oxidoreductase DCC family protein [Bacteroidota bacterium]
MGPDLKINIQEPVILFDGVCNLCNASVNFIIKRDPGAKFRFASLQSELGARLTDSESSNLDTLILVKDKHLYRESGAALRIARELKGGWKLLYLFMIIPAFIRDGVYRWVARNRYKWFGKRAQCMIPTPELKSRFLDS